MSTKLFDGKVLYDVSTLYELGQRVDEMRRVCRDLAKEEASKLIANKLSYIIDKDNNEDHDINWVEELGDIKLMGAYSDNDRVKRYLNKFIITNSLSNKNEEEYCSALIFLYEILQEKRNIIRELGRRDPLYDFDLSVSFYPLKDKTLFLVNCENDKMYKEAVRILGGEDYAYWDNIDPDENVTEEEWEQRRRDWDEVIDKFTTLQGFYVDIWGDYDYLDNFWMVPSKEEGSSEALMRVLNNIPTKKDRAEKLAFGILRRDCLRSKMEGVEETPGNIVESNYDCVDHLRSDEGRKEIEKKVNELYIEDIDGDKLKDLKLKKPVEESEEEKNPPIPPTKW